MRPQAGHDKRAHQTGRPECRKTGAACLRLLFCLWTALPGSATYASDTNAPAQQFPPREIAAAQHLITRCYEEYLERTPDEQGMTTYTDALLKEGRDEAWLRRIFAESPEHRAVVRAHRQQARQRANLLIATALILILTPIAAWALRRGYAGSLARRCTVLAARLPLPRLSTFARTLFKYRIPLAALLLAACVLFQLHGYSIGLWDEFVREKTPAYSFFSIGKNRAIRSDEWLVSTPWCLAQTQVTPPFPAFNARLYTDGMWMSLCTPNAPVLDISAIGQPHNWGFFLFGPARGLAWNYGIRYIGLFLLAMQFFVIVSGGQRLLPFAAALAITLAPPTQWWDTTVPYHLLYFFGACVSCHYFLRARHPLKTTAWAAAFLVALTSFLLLPYPPFQLPLLLTLAAVCLSMLKNTPPPKFDLNHLFPATAVLLITALILLRFAATNREGMLRLAHSVYPGARFCTGGHWTNLEALMYPMLSLFFPFREPAFSNACERSLFPAPWPALLLLAPRLLHRTDPGLPRRLFRIFVGIATLLLAWALFDWPPLLARITLLHLIPPARALVIASFLLLMAALTAFCLTPQNLCRAKKRTAHLTAAACAAAVLTCGLLHNEAFHYFFPAGLSVSGLLMLSASAGLFALLNEALLLGRTRRFCAALVLYALPAGIAVHPVNQGISPIMDKTLAVKARALQEQNPDATWLEIGAWPVFSQYLTALGLPVLTGVHAVPDVAFWKQFDPDGIYESCYNRYAHVVVQLTDEAAPRFTNPSGDRLDCLLRDEDLPAMPDPLLIITTAELPPPRFVCLETLPAERLSIYRLDPTAEMPVDASHGEPSD